MSLSRTNICVSQWCQRTWSIPRHRGRRNWGPLANQGLCWGLRLELELVQPCNCSGTELPDVWTHTFSLLCDVENLHITGSSGDLHETVTFMMKHRDTQNQTCLSTKRSEEHCQKAELRTGALGGRLPRGRAFWQIGEEINQPVVFMFPGNQFGCCSTLVLSFQDISSNWDREPNQGALSQGGWGVRLQYTASVVLCRTIIWFLYRFTILICPGIRGVLNIYLPNATNMIGTEQFQRCLHSHLVCQWWPASQFYSRSHRSRWKCWQINIEDPS